MYCVVYRSKKRAQTYLYVKKADDFTAVPDALLHSFGKPERILLLPLDGSKKLAGACLDKVRQALDEQGYYLQLPPPPENLLEQHRRLQQHVGSEGA